MMAAGILGLVLFIIQFIAKGNKRNNPITLIPPVLSAFFLLVYTLLAGHYFDEFKGYTYNHWAGTYDKDFMRPATFYFVFVVVLLALLVIAFVGYFLAKKRGIIDETITHTASIQVSQPSIADELKKYKELLDTGAITTDEYEAKKRELLNKSE